MVYRTYAIRDAIGRPLGMSSIRVRASTGSCQFRRRSPCRSALSRIEPGRVMGVDCQRRRRCCRAPKTRTFGWPIVRFPWQHRPPTFSVGVGMKSRASRSDTEHQSHIQVRRRARSCRQATALCGFLGTQSAGIRKRNPCLGIQRIERRSRSPYAQHNDRSLIIVSRASDSWRRNQHGQTGQQPDCQQHNTGPTHNQNSHLDGTLQHDTSPSEAESNPR